MQRRKRRRLITGLAGVALLLIGLLISDRVAAAVVAERVSKRIGCYSQLARQLKVSMGGVPFLTQLLQRSFDQISVTGHEITVGEFTASRVTATAKQVKLPASGPLLVGKLSVAVTVGYGKVPGIGTGAKLSSDDSGQLVIEATAPVLGRKLPVSVYARPELSGKTLTIRPTEVEVPSIGIRLPADRLPSNLAEARTINLPDLPLGLAYQDAKATRDGLRLDITGHDITASTTAGGSKGKCGGNPN